MMLSFRTVVPSSFLSSSTACTEKQKGKRNWKGKRSRETRKGLYGRKYRCLAAKISYARFLSNLSFYIQKNSSSPVSLQKSHLHLLGKYFCLLHLLSSSCSAFVIFCSAKESRHCTICNQFYNIIDENECNNAESIRLTYFSRKRQRWTHDSYAASHRYYGKRWVKFLTYGVEDWSVGQSRSNVRADDREVGPSELMNRWWTRRRAG